MSEKYEPIKFDSWQELAKYVIDGGEVYFEAADCKYNKIRFSGVGFDCDIEKVFSIRGIYTKKQPTLEELIAIKPRLCWVRNSFCDDKVLIMVDNYKLLVRKWMYYEMLTDDEIKQFLSGELDEQYGFGVDSCIVS